MPKQCIIHVAIVWYHFGLAQCLKSSDICEKPTYKHINIIIIIIIGILGRVDYWIIVRPYPPRICTSPYLQFQQSMTNSSHRSPGGGEGRMTGWRRELNPQPADRRKRDQLPRSLGHSGPQTYKHTYIHTYMTQAHFLSIVGTPASRLRRSASVWITFRETRKLRMLASYPNFHRILSLVLKL